MIKVETNIEISGCAKNASAARTVKLGCREVFMFMECPHGVDRYGSGSQSSPHARAVTASLDDTVATMQDLPTDDLRASLLAAFSASPPGR